MTDGITDAIRNAQVFVAVLGGRTTPTSRTLGASNCRTGQAVTCELSFSGGCTGLWVSDNLHSGISKAWRYGLDVNPTYQDLAEHYGVEVLPVRARWPQDKDKVENGVLVVTRLVLARLRCQRFFSLNELNRSLGTLLTDLNRCPFKKLPGSRASAFAAFDVVDDGAS